MNENQYEESQYEESQYEMKEAARKSSKPCTVSMILGVAADVMFFLMLFLTNVIFEYFNIWEKLGLGGGSIEDRINGRCGHNHYGVSLSGWGEISMWVLFLMCLASLICAFVGFVLAVYSLISNRPKNGRAMVGLICSGIGGFVLYFCLRIFTFALFNF